MFCFTWYLPVYLYQWCNESVRSKTSSFNCSCLDFFLFFSTLWIIDFVIEITQLCYLLHYLTSCTINWCLNDARNKDNDRFHVFQGTYESFWKSTYCQKDQGLLSTSEALNICEPLFVFYFHFSHQPLPHYDCQKKKLLSKPTFIELIHFCFHLK